MISSAEERPVRYVLGDVGIRVKSFFANDGTALVFREVLECQAAWIERMIRCYYAYPASTQPWEYFMYVYQLVGAFTLSREAHAGVCDDLDARCNELMEEFVWKHCCIVKAARKTLGMTT